MSETLPPPTPGPAPGSGDEPVRGEVVEQTRRSFLPLVLLVGGLALIGMWSIWALAIVVAIVVSIFLHELGHFLVAKRNGMKVTEFFLGFGPRIWSFRRGETEYGVKAIWAGAYVRIVGMHTLEEVPPADESRTYRAQPFRRRLPVVLAGPAMNLLLGLLILVVVFAGFGKPSETWSVADVTQASAAQAAGIQPGDKIVSVAGVQTNAFTELQKVVEAHPGETVPVVVERGGQQVTLDATLGFRLTSAGASVLPPLKAYDRILTVDGQPVTTLADLSHHLATASGPVKVTLERGDGTYETTVQAPVVLPADAATGFLGVGRNTGVTMTREGLLAAVGDAGSTFGSMITGSVGGLVHLFSPSGLGSLAGQVVNSTGSGNPAPSSGQAALVPIDGSKPAPSAPASSVSQDRVMSVLGIVRLGPELAKLGPAAILQLLAMVNIFLGLLNLIPLLPFDGGHAAIACYEEIRGRLAHREYRVDMAKLMPVAYAVVFVLAGIGLASMWLDIVKPVTIP